MRFFARLRNQLILSHLAAIGFTLVAMVGTVVFIGSSWFASQQSTANEPTQAARIVATALEGMVAHGASPTELNAVLGAMQTGDLRILAIPAAYAPQSIQSRTSWPGPALGNTDYVVILGPDGQLLGSSGPAAGLAAAAEKADWTALSR